MATWKKLVVSGSGVSQLNNDAGYLTSITAQSAFVTASFNGTALIADDSQGTLNFASGSTGLNIVANAGTDTLTFDLVAVPNSSLENDSVHISGSGISLTSVALGATASIDVQVDDSTIEIASDSLQLKDGGITFAKLAADSVVTSVEGISNATSGSDDSVATTKAIVDYVDAQVGGATLNIESGNDASSIAIDLNDETLTLTGNDGLEFNLAVNDAGIGIADGGINAVKLNSDVAGSGLTSTSGVLSLTNDTISGISLGNDLADLTVDDSSLELSTGTTYNGGTAKTISVKDLGITNAMLAGNIANDKLVNDSITIGNDTVALGGSTTLAATGFNSGSFSGSFQGDGQGLTGIATTLTIDSDTGGTSTVDLKTQTLDIAGGDNINTEVAGQTITVNLDSNISVTDAIVSGDLTVLGTASFQHETNLEVADRFILLASGSSSTGDGGIIVQQATQDVGEVFGFDGITGETRWGIGQAQNAASSSFTPDAFMAAVLEGTADTATNIEAAFDSRYSVNGNIYVDTSKTQDTDANIWIYA